VKQQHAPDELVVPVRWLIRKRPPPLSPDAALLLAYLVWWDEKGNSGEARWFTRSPDDIGGVLGFSCRTQTRLIQELKERWCIEVSPERGGRRQIRIHLHYRPGRSGGERTL